MKKVAIQISVAFLLFAFGVSIALAAGIKWESRAGAPNCIDFEISADVSDGYHHFIFGDGAETDVPFAAGLGKTDHCYPWDGTSFVASLVGGPSTTVTIGGSSGGSSYRTVSGESIPQPASCWQLVAVNLSPVGKNGVDVSLEVMGELDQFPFTVSFGDGDYADPHRVDGQAWLDGPHHYEDKTISNGVNLEVLTRVTGETCLSIGVNVKNRSNHVVRG